MAGYCKTFVAVMMAVLSLGPWTPQPPCAAGATACPACCCPCCRTTHGQSDMPCRPSCKLAQVQAFDQQLPARTLTGASVVGAHLLGLIAPGKINYPAFVSVVRRRDLNVSPPFGGSPPQAVLRLWLI